jgi:hypothetical protein
MCNMDESRFDQTAILLEKLFERDISVKSPTYPRFRSIS